MDTLWFKNAIIYQLHVKGFYDSSGDGIGDFEGLTQKLGYLESLGITAIWLLPFYPSPLKDDGYDIANYNGVHANYGSLRDFKNFLHQAHNRGIKVILELVINHTSDQHDWFQMSKIAPPDSVWRNFYIWSNDPHRYKEARIIFKDFESSNWTWDETRQAYYFHRFYSHQPDLNFDNPLVQREVFRIVNFWLEMGVDGLRLDAIPYIFKKEGTNCENLPETHAFVKNLRKFVDTRYSDRVLIAEANQWPEDAAAYFGASDECQMAFHFPVMPRLFMAIHMEDRFPIIDILEQTPVPPATCQWIMFLRNHDELTLEMVSDEERDYMYRIYAKDPKARINLGIRRRLAPLLDNDRAKIELMNILLFSLPGAPVLYYGDEIGMGDNYYLGDRNGVRTPMQWNSDRNAGFSKANPQKLFLPLIIDPSYHYELVNVENQEQNPSSLLWWIRHVLTVRKSHMAFGSGSFELITGDNPKILAFTRTHDDETILVITNLSRFSQAAELGLEKYAGNTPKELFHQNNFPQIKDSPYVITIGPYGYYWLSIQTEKTAETVLESTTAKIVVQKKWENIFKDKAKQQLERQVLPRYLKQARWFEHKADAFQNLRITSTFPIGKSMLCILEVLFREKNESETYLVPISFTTQSIKTVSDPIACIQVGDQEGVLYDSIHDETFRAALLENLAKQRRIKSDSSELFSYIRSDIKKAVLESSASSRVFSVEQSNSSMLYGQQFFFKLFRKLEEGIHPDVEISQFLTEKAHFANVPPFAGFIGYKKFHGPFTTIGFLEKFVANEATAWDFTQDALSMFYEQVLAIKDASSVSSQLEELIGGRYLDAAKILGERTAEMHLALATPSDSVDFRPEPFSTLHQRALYQEMRSNTKSAFQLINKELAGMSDTLKEQAVHILDRQEQILTFFRKLVQKPFVTMKTRIHGDYHLGQLLYTGKDFYITDFEGEPLHSLSARRQKHSPLRDVAGMIRSFHYAAHRALTTSSVIAPEMIVRLEAWAEAWSKHISLLFLQSYLQKIRSSHLLLVPKDDSDVHFLLNAFALQKALYEVTYELNVRPKWAMTSLKGILFVFKQCVEEH